MKIAAPVLAADLLKPVEPFYRVPQPRKGQFKSRYPPDQHRKRWCPEHGYLPFVQFYIYHGMMRRDCIACTNRKDAAYKRAKKLEHET